MEDEEEDEEEAGANGKDGECEEVALAGIAAGWALFIGDSISSVSGMVPSRFNPALLNASDWSLTERQTAPGLGGEQLLEMGAVAVGALVAVAFAVAVDVAAGTADFDEVKEEKSTLLSKPSIRLLVPSASFSDGFSRANSS